MLALLVGVAQFRQEDFDHLPLPRGPLPRLANLRFDLPGLGQACARFEPHAIVTEVRAQPRLHLRGAFGGLAVSVEPIPPFLGFGVGHPDLFGRAGQVGLADAHRAELVVVRVRLLQLAQLATLQDLGRAPGGGRGRPPEDRCGEAVRVTVKANHPLDKF